MFFKIFQRKVLHGKEEGIAVLGITVEFSENGAVTMLCNPVSMTALKSLNVQRTLSFEKRAIADIFHSDGRSRRCPVGSTQLPSPPSNVGWVSLHRALEARRDHMTLALGSLFSTRRFSHPPSEESEHLPSYQGCAAVDFQILPPAARIHRERTQAAGCSWPRRPIPYSMPSIRGPSTEKMKPNKLRRRRP